MKFTLHDNTFNFFFFLPKATSFCLPSVGGNDEFAESLSSILQTEKKNFLSHHILK